MVLRTVRAPCPGDTKSVPARSVPQRALTLCDSERVSRELPSIYLFSVSEEKCVARRQKFFRDSRSTVGQPAQLGEEALHFLAYRVRGDGVGLANLIGGVSIELELNEKVQFRVGEKSFCDAAVQEVP